jgi:hypothetical protein
MDFNLVLVEHASTAVGNLFSAKLKAFLDFVLARFISVVVE